ncbi:hypothetical protein [Acinetobacter faecalis]|uniref:hypothetical protein n=1 Tax=Acinetobacter faecalis TaxID=2665161 RepID=UPI002A912A64|nr:hypothetical protein [Acinetobacter faecalis]MDY6460750.1 hypothetical protein [Acinetobacter faecalis]
MQTLYSVNELIDASENKLSIHTIKDYCRRGELHPCIYFEGNIVCIHDERFQNSIDKRDPVAHIETVSWARTFKGYISASNFIDYIAHTDTQASDVFFNVTKIIEHISLINDFPLLQKDEYLKAFPSIIDDDIQEKRWLHEINDFKGNIFKAHEIVFHVSEVEKLLLTHSKPSQSPVKFLNNTEDLGGENLQENSNIKKRINLKDMLEDMDDYISVSSVFELIKERTDLKKDTEVANFLIVNKINDLSNPVNKFHYFDGKPTPLYKDFQQKQLTKMDLLLLEIAREELKLNSEDERLKNFAWEKFDFFFKFQNLTNIDLEEEVIQDDILQIQDSISLEPLSIQQTEPNIENLNSEITQLRKLVAEKNAEINMLQKENKSIKKITESQLEQSPQQEIPNSKTRNKVSILIAVLCELNKLDITQHHGEPNALILDQAFKLKASLGKDFVGNWLKLAQENIK